VRPIEASGVSEHAPSASGARTDTRETMRSDLFTGAPESLPRALGNRSKVARSGGGGIADEKTISEGER
jgi:hypothetical protein